MPADRPVPPEFKPPATASALTAALAVLLSGRTLSADQTAAAFESIMTGGAHHGEIGALLSLLATRIPTTDEILGAARVMRKHVDRVETDPLQQRCHRLGRTLHLGRVEAGRRHTWNLNELFELA